MMRSTRTTRTSMTRGMIPMGGRSFKRGMIPMRGMSGPPTFRMTNTKAQLIKPDQGTKYHPHAYGAAVALQNNNGFTHTKKGVGMWWKASFAGGEQWVWKVRVQNRVDCCGSRLKGTKITVGGQVCGVINQNTQNG